MKQVGTAPSRRPVERKLRVAAGASAVTWGCLLLAGLLQPAVWAVGEVGSSGHMDRFMVGLWLVTLVVAPLLAVYDPLRFRGALDVHLLGVLAILVGDFHPEPPWLFTHARYVAAAVLTAALILWAHQHQRSQTP